MGFTNERTTGGGEEAPLTQPLESLRTSLNSTSLLKFPRTLASIMICSEHSFLVSQAL